MGFAKSGLGLLAKPKAHIKFVLCVLGWFLLHRVASQRTKLVKGKVANHIKSNISLNNDKKDKPSFYLNKANMIITIRFNIMEDHGLNHYP